jgi:RNA polymerase sigma factor (sigma-70 family)
VARLPELDQLVYRYIYVRGMPRDECLYVLQAKYPELTDQQLAEINARLFSLLTPRQRWQLSARRSSQVSLDDSPDADADEAALQVEAPDPGPEELSQADQERRRLEAAMAQLPARQRLLLRLRYEQNLTLEEVARLTRLPDPFRAHRQIQAALAALAEIIKTRQ